MNRKGFIGGSDCVKIMQGEWLELWQVKTGRAESADLSDVLPVQLGIWTESFNLNWFEQRYGCVLHNHQYEFEQNIGGIPAKGTVDAMVKGMHVSKTELSGLAIVEAKHTNAYTNMDEQLARYMPQIQLYCHRSNVDGAYLSVIFGNSKWEAVYVRYDEEYFNSMWAVVSDFWGYVVRDEEPIGVDTQALSIDGIPLDEMVARDATHDNAFVDAAVTYIQGYEQNRTWENAKKDLKAMVADNEREVYCDYLTIKRDKRGSLRITKR